MQVYATETITVSQARILCSIAPVSESQHLSSKKLPLTKITKDLNLKDVISKSLVGLRVYAIWAAKAHPHSSMFTLRWSDKRQGYVPEQSLVGYG